MSQGDTVSVAAASPARVASSPAQLVSFLMDRSKVGARFAVISVAVSPPSTHLRVVQLLGRGSKCLVSLDTAGSELSKAVRSEHERFLLGLAATKSATLKKRCQIRKRPVPDDSAALRSPECITPPPPRHSRTSDTSPLIPPLSASTTTSPLTPSESHAESYNSHGCSTLQAKIRELTGQALQQGMIITACPIQARNGRVTLDIKSYGMTCDVCKLLGVWDDVDDNALSLVGCMDCTAVRHAKCIAPIATEEGRCEDCFQTASFPLFDPIL